MRRFTPLELAVFVALLGSLLAVGVPAFLRDLHASRFVEPTEGLARIGAAAVAAANVSQRFPEGAPITPKTPPRGKKEADPPGTWETPAWQALAFRPSAEGVPHAYSFSFENTANGNAFVAQARGDLDGDGTFSTFEIRGSRVDQKAIVAPGMYVEAELE